MAALGDFRDSFSGRNLLMFEQHPALEMDPAAELPAVINLLGRAYLDLGDLARTRRKFERVTAHDPDYQDVQALLAEAGRLSPQRQAVS